MTQILLAIVFGPVLWLAGAIAFDAVHWLLHGMLNSRFALLRSLAHPHAVHHQWIDQDLDTNWELQSANIWCHIVPEYATQLGFTAVVALVLPLPFAVVLGLLQTAVFVGILHCRGRDLNHRPEARIDAHPPGWLTPPSYHLLHHVWPDAYFSAYTKLVDYLVGGGAQIAGRRFRWVGPDSPLAGALRQAVAEAGGLDVDAVEDADVTVLLDAGEPLAGPVEAVIEVTRERQLPPEVWALRAADADPVARHYLRDVRVCFRSLLLPGDEAGMRGELDPAAAARRALFWIRRDAHVVSLLGLRDVAAVRRFHAAAPAVPSGARIVRHRLEYAA